MRVLAVDDSPTMREMVRAALEKAGIDVVLAVHGEDGLERLETETKAKNKFDVVLTDLNMPIMDGLALTRSIRARPHHAGIPILFLTTEAGPELRTEARAAGATGWIVKPFDPDSLVRTLRRIAA